MFMNSRMPCVASSRPWPDALMPPNGSAGNDATYDRTIEYVGGITDADLARVVDKRWDPPVTLGVRLMSVVSDDLQHAGQAAFVRGLLPR